MRWGPLGPYEERPWMSRVSTALVQVLFGQAHWFLRMVWYLPTFLKEQADWNLGQVCLTESAFLSIPSPCLRAEGKRQTGREPGKEYTRKEAEGEWRRRRARKSLQHPRELGIVVYRGQWPSRCKQQVLTAHTRHLAMRLFLLFLAGLQNPSFSYVCHWDLC